MYFNLMIIGDEILHGNRADKHFAFFKSLLAQYGLQLGQVQYLPDERALLVKQLQRSFSDGLPTFVTGGIGATPDDHTRQAAAEALESGQAELAVGFFPDLQKAGFFRQGLFKTSYACITCARNETAGARMTLDQFLAARHVMVRPEGREHTFDRMLEERGHHRRVMLELSHFMSLLSILPGSDLVATVPDDIATAVGRYIAIRHIALPLSPPVIEVQQYWHRRMQHDAANRWLRGVFHSVNRRDGQAPLPG